MACLKPKGMMVSFGNASGPLDPVNVPKEIQPKAFSLQDQLLDIILQIEMNFKRVLMKYLKKLNLGK